MCDAQASFIGRMGEGNGCYVELPLDSAIFDAGVTITLVISSVPAS